MGWLRGMVFVLFIAVVALAADSSADISGGFGFSFGETLKQGDIVKSKDAESQVKPRKPVRNLTFYVVSTTPTSKKVYLIAGMQMFKNMTDAENEAAVLVSLLEKKYGLKMNKLQFEFNPTWQMKDSDGDAIQISIKRGLESQLSIIYVSAELSSLAEKERIGVESKNTNADGL